MATAVKPHLLYCCAQLQDTDTSSDAAIAGQLWRWTGPRGERPTSDDGAVGVTTAYQHVPCRQTVKESCGSHLRLLRGINPLLFRIDQTRTTAHSQCQAVHRGVDRLWRRHLCATKHHVCRRQPYLTAIPHRHATERQQLKLLWLGALGSVPN